jgi:hypothetical protein
VLQKIGRASEITGSKLAATLISSLSLSFGLGQVFVQRA